MQIISKYSAFLTDSLRDNVNRIFLTVFIGIALTIRVKIISFPH